MVKSILLLLGQERESVQPGQLGVELAQRSGARLHGCSILDSRRAEEAAAGHEAACFALSEYGRLQRVEAAQKQSGAGLSVASRNAGVPCHIRQFCGDPLEILPREARYHDLVVAGLEHLRPGGRTAGRLDRRVLLRCVDRGVHPLLVVPEGKTSIERILLAYDGTVESAAAIRRFAAHRLFEGAEIRIAAFGRTSEEARVLMQEVAGYCHAQGLEPEWGCLHGSLRRLLPHYARQWQADLVVLGSPPTRGLGRRLVRPVAAQMLRSADCAVYLGR